MKRSVVLAVVIPCLLFPLSALSYTVYVGVDDSLQLSSIDGFQFDASAAVSELVLTTFTVGSFVNVDGAIKPAAVPVSGGWEIGKLPSYSISGINFSSGSGPPLSQGIILSLDQIEPFGLVLGSFLLYDYSKPQPLYLYSGTFGVTENLFNGGAEYTITAAPVPIPPTLLLLGAGLAGLAAMRWRKGA